MLADHFVASARTQDHAARPVLVFGSDTNAFLGTVRSLGRAGIDVHAAGCGPDMPAGQSRYISRHHDIPPYSGDGADWVKRVAELTAWYDYALIIPTSDSSLIQLDRHAVALGRARVATPPSAALDTLTDKARTRDLARELGVPVAEGLLVTLETLDRLPPDFRFPAILKSAHSYRAGDTVQKSPVSIVPDRAALAAALADGEEMLVERYLPGFCRGVSVLAQDGRVVQAFQHRRLRQEHATGPSSWRLSETLDPRMLEAVRALVAHTRYTGVAMFEFRCDERDGSFALLEVNPRFWGSLHLALAAGADYPASLHAMLVNGTPLTERLDFAAGIESRSVWGEYDAHIRALDDAASTGARAKAAMQLMRFLATLALTRGFDSFTPDDPAPFRAERRRVRVRIAARLRRGLMPGGPRGGHG